MKYKTVGQFRNEYGEMFYIARRNNKFYFRGDDFSMHWKEINLSKYVFNDFELLKINSIIKNNMFSL